MSTKYTKSTTDKVLMGVVAGIAKNYPNVDVTMARLGTVVGTVLLSLLFGFPLVLFPVLYLLAGVIMPKDTDV